MGYRLGVDVGGTFTDLLLFDDQDGRFWRHKTPSTPADSSEGVVNGILAICSLAEIFPVDIGMLLHGTTVATNAILEDKGARVGLIVSEGYHQTLQIGRSLVPGGLAGWIIWPKPEPLAKLEDTCEIAGRLSSSGAEVSPIDRAQIEQTLRALSARGVDAITVCLMNAYANGVHELSVSEIAAAVIPQMPISLSHQVLPEMQEYERALTTVANAAVRPVVSRYVAHLRTKLRSLGMKGQIALLRSDGGLMASETAERVPVALLMSGPAGGVAGALWVAKNAGFSNLLTLDVGGTSTDVALIQNGEPRLGRTTSVGNLTVRASSLDIKTVGAGGGSIARLPELTKALRVGPESAGASPGPACYGRGGTLPTVTDANVVLGYLPENLLGGSFMLNRDAARRAVLKIAEPLGISVQEAARGIVDIVNENMFGALRMISVQQGYDPREFALMGFGGAGPLHANAVGRLMGSWPVISPVSPGVLCALGDATTRMRTEVARSFSRLISNTSQSEVQAELNNLGDQAISQLESEGVAIEHISVTYQIDLRYSGQAFEVPMSTTPDLIRDKGLSHLAQVFDDEHRRLFTFNMDAEHELVNLRATAIGQALSLPAREIERGTGDPSNAKIRDHEVWMDGVAKPAAIYQRAPLRAGDVIRGPAIITEMDATTLILADCIGKLDLFGNILIAPA